MMMYGLVGLLIVLCGLQLVITVIRSVYQQKEQALSQNENQNLMISLTEQLTRHENLVQQLRENFLEKLHDQRIHQQQQLIELKEQIHNAFHQHRNRFDERQLESFKLLQDSLQQGICHMRQHIQDTLKQHTEELNKRVEKLTFNTDQQLQQISGQVEKRLTQGFEKTTETFVQVIERLKEIDNAQKKITELSSNVVSLQEVLADKRARGAFGEIQLANLLQNMLPANHFALQYTLSNDRRVDCMLFLPEPTGNIAIDAKFPLENYRRLIDASIDKAERTLLERQFRTDIQKHIRDIASKYIIPGETSDGAIMFIPAEAIFAEIHAHHGSLIDEAHQARVWIVSPTTMMAILTTARTVLKDAATRKHVHIIQEHLKHLSNDFSRLQDRMSKLAKHVEQAHQDAQEVSISARKITGRFNKIERVELSENSLSLQDDVEWFNEIEQTEGNK